MRLNPCFFPVTGFVVLRQTRVPVDFCLSAVFAAFAFVCRTSKLVLARIKIGFSLYCSARQLKTKLVWAHVKTRNSARQNGLFPALLPFYSLLHAPDKGEAKEGSTKGDEAGQNKPAPAGPGVSEAPAGVVRTIVTAKICSHRCIRVEISTRTRWFSLCWKFGIFHGKFMCGVSPYPTQPLFATPLYHWVPLQTLPTVGRLLPPQSVPKAVLNFPKPCFQTVL